MGFQGFDLFDVERDEFNRQFHEVVLPLFEVSHEGVAARAFEIESEYREALSKATSEADEINAQGWAVYKETSLDEQKEMLGAASLNVLNLALRDGLQSMSRYFNGSHPPRGSYQGKSWLRRRQAEFDDRFGIDFEKSPAEFARIEELVLARNAGIHPDEATRKEYEQAIISPRFLRYGLFSVEKDALIESFRNANRFLEWVWDELKRIRLQSNPKQQR